MIALGAYFALGLVVLASRLLFPKAKASTAAAAAPAIQHEEPELRKAA
jgi:hypothetical protein